MKDTGCSSRGLGTDSQHPHGSSYKGKRRDGRKAEYIWLYCCPAPVQSEGPGVEMLLSPPEDGNIHVLLQLRQRFAGLARCLGLMLRCVDIGRNGLGAGKVAVGMWSQAGVTALRFSFLWFSSSEFGAPVSVPVQEILDLICRILGISSKNIVSGLCLLNCSLA